MILDVEKSGVLVSGLFFCSCSLWSFFLASILKASVGSEHGVGIFWLSVGTTRHLRVVMYNYRPIGLQ